MNDLLTIFLSGGFSVVLASAVAFLFRNWIGERLKNAIRYEYDEKIKIIENEYAQKLETHKAQLQAASAIELEQLKSKLQIAAQERNIKLTSTFDQQRETIETLYSGIIRLNQAVINLGKSLWAETVEEKAKIVEEAKTKFMLDVYPKAIYLPPDVIEDVGRLAKAASILAKTYNEVTRLEQQLPRASHLLQSANAILEHIPELEKNLEDSIDTVVNDFQRLLGIQT